MESFWDKSIKIIQGNISKHNFDTWMKPIKVAAIEDNCVRLTVPNKFFKDWLMDNYLAVIKNALHEVIGMDVDIHFLISKEKEKKPDAPVLPFNSSASHAAAKVAEKTKNLTNLNSNYTFDRFVVGPSNQFAHAASIAVGKQPSKNYNPLFIYGGSGLGKTHLLNAIGLMACAAYPDLNVLYVSAEAFMNEMVNAIRYDRMPKFREKYRNIGCLLIDDIQFIGGKERTQEEFFHTFNTLYDSGKQVVVTSDKFPKDIPNLEGRLRSRFEWGLIADIQPPEMETKIAIIKKKTQESKLSLSPAVMQYIASHVESNIRELEGFLIRIAAFSSLTHREIDLELVKEALKKVLKHNYSEDISVDEIIKAVAGRANIKISDMKSHNKNKNMVLSRQISMYLARKLTNLSYPDIGQIFGGRDHSTVIYANKKISESIKTDAKLKKNGSRFGRQYYPQFVAGILTAYPQEKK